MLVVPPPFWKRTGFPVLMKLITEVSWGFRVIWSKLAAVGYDADSGDPPTSTAVDLFGDEREPVGAVFRYHGDGVTGLQRAELQALYCAHVVWGCSSHLCHFSPLFRHL